MSQRDLAAVIGGSYQSVSNYERGISAPGDETCKRIAALFHVTATSVRERWGKYVEQGEQPVVPPPLIRLEDAIRADTTLHPEAKTSLIQLVGLLRAQPTQGETPESLARELRAARGETATSRKQRTDRPCQT